MVVGWDAAFWRASRLRTLVGIFLNDDGAVAEVLDNLDEGRRSIEEFDALAARLYIAELALRLNRSQKARAAGAVAGVSDLGFEHALQLGVFWEQ